jgi:polyhydroxyalkanoate synthase subunit PhaC
VFRNELMELLQYEPQTETTFEVPVLLSPPWINKYYIMDLSPGRSFAEWAVKAGHTTFAISYRNPDASMSDVRLDDYLIHGPLAAIDVISDIAGQPRINIVGLCLGGTLTAILLAYLASRGDDRIGCASLLNTLVDFSQPGVLGVFTDERTVARLEASMQKKGYLESRQMASTFDLLRANDLIWSYVGTNWLMGQKPPAFDILAWNGDSTRMPANMHSFYLRSCYLNNQLARGDMEIAGTTLHLEDIAEEVYVLGAKEDHIAPWSAQYRTTQLLKSTRFVLSTSGHIAGIVNPPSAKAMYWTNEHVPDDPDAWLEGAVAHKKSWWEDWSDWIGKRAGGQRTPPPTGSPNHPALGPAPGTYVKVKVS